ncbi:PqqD family protein [Paracoccus sp. (in: a-proteobacteria)]|uniref:PqqD family protein n=1 Tax=Paracoccus sp. TaxID=267 RepID=UPI00396C87B6
MVYIASPDCVACAVDDGVAILDLRSNTYFSLDPVGADVWQQLSAPSSLDDLATAIADQYMITAGECRRDIAKLLEDMTKHGLVQTV